MQDNNTQNTAAALPSSLLFLVAAIYTLLAGSMNAITVLAFLSLVILSSFAIARKTTLAILGGAILIVSSLTLQTVLQYKCMVCLKTDLIIAGAMIACVFINSTQKRKILSALTVTATALVIFAMAMSIEEPKDLTSIYTLGGEKIGVAQQMEKPVLIFSPMCSACTPVLEEIISVDPKGEKWCAVVSGSNQYEIEKAQSKLSSLGFLGDLYVCDWDGAVPTIISLENNKLHITHSADAVIKQIQNS